MHLFHILGEGMAIWRKSTSVITVSYVLNQPFFHETHFDLKEWQTGYRDSNLVDIFLKWKKKKSQPVTSRVKHQQYLLPMINIWISKLKCRIMENFYLILWTGQLHNSEDFSDEISDTNFLFFCFCSLLHNQMCQIWGKLLTQSTSFPNFQIHCVTKS